MIRPGMTVVVAWMLIVGLVADTVSACPFCAAQQQTLTEEIDANDVAVILELVSRAPKPAGAGDLDPFSPEAGKCKFRIIEVLKGDREKLLAQPEIEILYFGDQAVKTRFFAFGIEPPNVQWSTPTPLNEKSEAYVRKLPTLPASGADRLFFFQQYLNDADPLLAGDAYDEFARSPYADVQALAPRMPRQDLLTWIQDPELSSSRRRLFLTMLGVCGQPEDVSVLVTLIRNDDRQMRAALDALAACYLNLTGADGLALIEETFLKDPNAEYTDTYSTIMALRFHGQETDIIPRARLIEAMRHMLSRPKLADLVIPDLARWQDWDSMDRLVQLFRDSMPKPDADTKSDTFEDTSWVRVPVINFLRACPLPKAKEYLAELEQLDPDAFRRASFFTPFGSATSGATRAEGEKAKAEDNDAPAKPAADEPTAGENSAPAAGTGQFSVEDDLRQRPVVVQTGYRAAPANQVAQAQPQQAASLTSARPRNDPPATLGPWSDFTARLMVPLYSLGAGLGLAVLIGSILQRSQPRGRV